MWLGHANRDDNDKPVRTEAWYFAQEILGRPVTRPARSPEIDAHEAELRAFVRDITTVREADWDPAKHPRGGFPQNRGMFSTTWGPKGSSKAPSGQEPKLPSMGDATLQGVTQGVAPSDPSKPSRWYLPSDNKGSWSGEKGNSKFRLKTPLSVGSELVYEIEYQNNLPVLERHAVAGKSVSVILTGDSKKDIANAKTAWQKLNPAESLPGKTTFHHDLLHVVEETVEINGRKTKVLVGKMHLIPTSIHQLVFHEGSASVAYKFYKGLGTNVDAVKRLASQEAAVAHETKGLVASAAKKIVPGKIAKGILPFIGRNVIRAIPLISSGLAILEFAENAEAHGIGGAAARAVPVLGDLISAHDLGSDLAKQITDEAIAAMVASYKKNNAEVADAWEKANQQTLDAFNELAPQIEVTNDGYDNGELVDADEIAAALKLYRGRMQENNLLRTARAPGFNFDAASAEAKRNLRQRLIEASQKRAPKRKSGPLA
jgi:hypothetical protein